MFFAYNNEDHARAMLGGRFEQIVSQEPVSRTTRVCSRDRGRCRGSLPFADDGVTLFVEGQFRFVYDDGGPPDDGIDDTTVTYTHDGHQYAWASK